MVEALKKVRVEFERVSLAYGRTQVLHDVSIDRFGQWWRRCLRSGHAEAQVASRHGWLHDKAATRGYWDGEKTR